MTEDNCLSKAIAAGSISQELMRSWSSKYGQMGLLEVSGLSTCPKQGSDQHLVGSAVALSYEVMKSPKDRESTASLGSLFLGFTTLPVKKLCHHVQPEFSMLLFVAIVLSYIVCHC